MKTMRTKAFVLRRTNYGEADRIIQLLTPEHGKVSIIARGVRREKSKLAGGIELFARCDVTISSGKGELGILTGARLEQFYGHIMQDYDRLQFGYEVIKQVTRATENINEPAFFDLVDQALASLDEVSIAPSVTQTWFWLQLAILQGVGMNLSTDANGMKLVEDANYNFSEHDHAFVFSEKGTYTSDHVKLLRLLSAQSPRVASHVSGVKSLISECLWIAERAVAH
jgi:DNA repair protein RecO (recombination protein O)